MRKMEIAAIYPKPKLSKANREHQLSLYLLRELVIDRPNQVWCTDITDIRLVGGVVYLIAVIDW